MTWLEQTYELLDKSRLSIDKISEDTGLKRRWLYNLRGKMMKDPGVNKVEIVYWYLYDYLHPDG